MSPSPLTVAVEQGTATFYCKHLTCDNIGWRVNGVPVNRINSPNISINDIQESGGGRINTLSIGTLLEFNQTAVECVAVFFHGTPSPLTPAVTLLIQGLLNIIKILIIVMLSNKPKLKLMIVLS